MKFISAAIAVSAAFMAAGSLAIAGYSGQNGAIKLRLGMKTPGVAVLQENLRLNTRGNFYNCQCSFDGDFGSGTLAGLKHWQKRTGYKPTGWIVIGSSQWNQLRHEVMKYRLPESIDIRTVGGARQTGWAIDASKRSDRLYVLRFDAAHRKFSARLSTPTSFGGCNSDGCFVTPSGAFPVCRKAGANEVSHEWKDASGQPAKMPFSLYMLIGGRCSGTAVHYDPLGNSHQCVHIPSWPLAEYLYNNFPIGGLVVIHDTPGL